MEEQSISVSDFKLYFKAIVAKTAWHLHKNKHIDQWKTIENPEANVHIYGQLIHHKRANNVSGKKETLFIKWQPTPVLLPRKFHGWKSLVGYSPRGHKELDRTEWVHFHFQ